MSYTIDGDVITISVAGRVDSTNAPALELEIQGALASKHYAEAVLDCDELEYISSAGLRVLVATQKLAERRGGTMVIRHPSDEVYDIFDMTGLADVFTIER